MTVGRSSWWVGLVVSVGLLSGTAVSQQDKQQDIPDAPSAVRPPQPLPTPPVAATPETPSQQSTEPPASTPPASSDDPEAPLPSSKVKTVPEGGATPDNTQAPSDLYRIVRNVNQVMVPVMVKDESGRLVSGLVAKDFQVLKTGPSRR